MSIDKINKSEFTDFLEDFLMEDEAKELGITLGEEEAAPVIDSPSTANFYLKLMNRIQENIDDVNQICNEEIEKHNKRVETFREDKLRTYTKQYAYYEGLLKNFTEHQLADSKKKSVSLPFGTLSLKKQPAKWDYNDEELLKWMKKNKPELINSKVTETVDKKQVKTLVGKDVVGEIEIDGKKVEGVVVTAQPDKFSVKIK